MPAGARARFPAPPSASRSRTPPLRSGCLWGPETESPGALHRPWREIDQSAALHCEVKVVGSLVRYGLDLPVKSEQASAAAAWSGYREVLSAFFR
jgi:hypothetical protein